MKPIEIQDNIDNYLLNRMDDATRKAFEQEIAMSKELKEQVEIQRLVMEQLKNCREFEQILDKFPESSLRPKVLKFNFKQTMSIISSVAAVFVAVFFIHQSIVFSRMDNLYAQNFSSPAQENYRGAGVDTEEKEFIKAVEYLNTKQPDKAKTALLLLYQKDSHYSYYEAVRWYLALTELKLHHKSDAKKYLNELVDSEFYGEKANKMLKEL